MALSAAVDKDVARNLCIVHAILFHTLNLAVPKPLDSLSAISRLFRVKSGFHDIVEFQPMSKLGTDQKSASEYAESTR